LSGRKLGVFETMPTVLDSLRIHRSVAAGRRGARAVGARASWPSASALSHGRKFRSFVNSPASRGTTNRILRKLRPNVANIDHDPRSMRRPRKSSQRTRPPSHTNDLVDSDHEE